MLAVLMAGGTLVVPTVAMADSVDVQKAERRRLRDEAVRLMQKGAWSGVEKTYQQIRKLKKVSVCWPDYLAGANAAMNLGKSEEIITRLWGATTTMNKLPKTCVTKKNKEDAANLKTWLSATLGDFGYVDIKVKKGVTIGWDNAPFEPSVRQAGDKIFKIIASKRKYKGLMPKGTYTVKKSTTKKITVKRANWMKSGQCAVKQSKKKRPKFSKCIKKTKAQKVRLKKAKK
jgi:hypothetical protein